MIALNRKNKKEKRKKKAKKLNITLTYTMTDNTTYSVRSGPNKRILGWKE